MADRKDKRYRIDGEPVTAGELIRAAAQIDEAFERDWFKQTSVAANILRDAGHVVDDNPDAAESGEAQ